jgi:hypothetical protein
MVLGITCGDASTTVTYFQAWEYWASGRPDSGCLVLWGLSLRWWGRLGQLVAFSGTLLVVADIVDLEGFAQSLRAVRPAFKKAASAAGELVLGITVLLRWPLFVIAIGAVVAYIVRYGLGGYEKLLRCGNPDMAFSGCTPAEEWHYFRQFLPYNIYFLYIGGTIGVTLLFVLLIGVVIPDLILKPVAWLLRILPRWAKVLNLLLIVIAFHFNLLAS